MLVILEGLSTPQRRALLPALRRLLGPDARWETIPPHAEMFGRPRLERLLTLVESFDPKGRPLLIDGWILSPIRSDEFAVKEDHELRALALARLAQSQGSVLIRGDSDPTGADSRVDLWQELLVIQTPVMFHKGNVIDEALSRGGPEDLTLLPHRGIGHPCPRIVLVGEGPSKNTWRGLPFSGGPAAKLVREALRGHGDVYLLNAAGGVGQPAPDDELLFLALRNDTLKFIALGKEASRLLTRLKIEHVLLLHPAHVERFHSEDVVNWVAQLRTLLEK